MKKIVTFFAGNPLLSTVNGRAQLRTGYFSPGKGVLIISRPPAAVY